MAPRAVSRRPSEPGGVAGHPHRSRVTGREQLPQPGQRQLAVLRPQRVQDGRDGGVAVQAAALAAAAQRAALVDGDVADLADPAGRAADQGPAGPVP
jgi:hypothetical protein